MSPRATGLILGLALLAAGGGFLAGRALQEGRGAPVPALEDAVRDRLPATLGLVTPDGRGVVLGDYLGQPLLVNFWATWCAPCRREMPALTAVHAELAPAAQVLGVALDRREAVTGFLAELAIDYPVLVAPDLEGTRLVQSLGNPGGLMPFSVFVDGQGRVRARRLGELSAAEARAGLRQLLDAGAEPAP